MTLNELRYAIAVAKEKNFRRAAERCFVTQPALSLGIKHLEQKLGVRLFERGKTEVRLTPAGAQVVAQAQRALEEVERVKAVALTGQDPLAGPLKLGLIHTVGPYLLPDLIPTLKALAPAMPLEVEENTTANLERLLKEGRIDIAVLALPFAAPGILTRALYDEDFELVVPKGHALARAKRAVASALQSERVLLLGEGHCFANQVAEACPGVRHGNEPQSGNSLETIRNMVASGLGITVLPASANAPRYRSPLLNVIAFAAPAPSRRIALAWRSSYARTAAIDAVTQAVREIKRPPWRLLPPPRGQSR